MLPGSYQTRRSHLCRPNLQTGSSLQPDDRWHWESKRSSPLQVTPRNTMVRTELDCASAKTQRLLPQDRTEAQAEMSQSQSPLCTSAGRVHSKQTGVVSTRARSATVCLDRPLRSCSASWGSLTTLSYALGSSLAQQDKHRKPLIIGHSNVYCTNRRLTQHSMVNPALHPPLKALPYPLSPGLTHCGHCSPLHPSTHLIPHTGYSGKEP